MVLSVPPSCTLLTSYTFQSPHLTRLHLAPILYTHYLFIIKQHIFAKIFLYGVCFAAVGIPKLQHLSFSSVQACCYYIMLCAIMFAFMQQLEGETFSLQILQHKLLTYLEIVKILYKFSNLAAMLE